jgi:hypothetical protein
MASQEFRREAATLAVSGGNPRNCNSYWAAEMDSDDAIIGITV